MNTWFYRRGIEMHLPPIDLNSTRWLRLGGMPKAELLASLKNAGVCLNRAAEELFDSPLFETQAHIVSIPTVELRVEELGFTEGAPMPEILRAAYGMGLLPCPMEAGPHLRLQFRDQPEGSNGGASKPGQAPPGSLTVVSLPLLDSVDFPKGFYLRRIEGLLWLRGYRADDQHLWSPGDHLLFQRAGV